MIVMSMFIIYPFVCDSLTTTSKEKTIFAIFASNSKAFALLENNMHGDVFLSGSNLQRHTYCEGFKDIKVCYYLKLEVTKFGKKLIALLTLGLKRLSA